MSSAEWRADVLRFWFGLSDDLWFKADPKLDHQIKQRFLKLWSEKRQLPVDSFLTDPLTALAGIILFDQFSRNMFRDNAEQFATDPLALAIAKGAIERHFDDDVAQNERAFLYLPFAHSEVIADQNRSILLFTDLGDPRQLKFAKLHQEIIQRFGRFPHRNAMLGRTPRAEEIAAGDLAPW